MNEKLAAIGEFLSTMGTGIIEALKHALNAGTMLAVLLAMAIIFALPAWAMFVTALDLISQQHPGNSVWTTTTNGTPLFYLQRIGQGIALIWICRGIYQLGKDKHHG